MHYYWKWISYWKTFLFSENYDCRILIKTSIFFRKCLFVHVFIFIKVFYLLENCYFDSKYHFIWWYFGQKCHFPSRIYISGGIHSLDKLSNFLRKGQILEKRQLALEVIYPLKGVGNGKINVFKELTPHSRTFWASRPRKKINK